MYSCVLEKMTTLRAWLVIKIVTYPDGKNSYYQ